MSSTGLSKKHRSRGHFIRWSSGPALKVITAGNGYQTQKQSPSIGLFRVLNQTR